MPTQSKVLRVPRAPASREEQIKSLETGEEVMKPFPGHEPPDQRPDGFAIRPYAFGWTFEPDSDGGQWRCPAEHVVLPIRGREAIGLFCRACGAIYPGPILRQDWLGNSARDNDLLKISRYFPDISKLWDMNKDKRRRIDVVDVLARYTGWYFKPYDKSLCPACYEPIYSDARNSECKRCTLSTADLQIYTNILGLANLSYSDFMTSLLALQHQMAYCAGISISSAKLNQHMHNVARLGDIIQRLNATIGQSRKAIEMLGTLFWEMRMAEKGDAYLWKTGFGMVQGKRGSRLYGRRISKDIIMMYPEMWYLDALEGPRLSVRGPRLVAKVVDMQSIFDSIPGLGDFEEFKRNLVLGYPEVTVKYSSPI